MTNSLICPHCNKPIPITDAINASLEKAYTGKINERIKENEEKIKHDMNLLFQEKEKQNILEIKKSLTRQFVMEMKNKENEASELQKINSNLQKQILELNRMIRSIKQEYDMRKLDLEKRFNKSHDSLKEQIRVQIDQEYKYKILEKEKKLSDAMKLVDEYKSKLTTDSQQLQGEVLEIEIKKLLQKTFLNDNIQPVGKGIMGADIIQTVNNTKGDECGKIIWEFKRTKNWSEEWIVKLKDDQRRSISDFAVLITQVLPKSITYFGYYKNIWIGNYQSVIPLATVLRFSILQTALIKNTQEDKHEKLEILHKYITGIEFKQKIEAIVEAFSIMQNELEKEKRFFTMKWARQEKNIRKVLDHTLSMHGDLQAITGQKTMLLKDQEDDIVLENQSLF